MQGEQKKFIGVLVACAVIFFGGEYLIQKWRGVNPPLQENSELLSQENSSSLMGTPENPYIAPKPVLLDRAEALKNSRRVRIETPTLRGSLNLQGGVIDDLSLKNYHETTSPESSEIILLSPGNTRNAYDVKVQWGSVTREAVALPNASSVWTADRDLLTPQTPVTLSWQNGQGLRFEQIIRVDDQYVFDITHRVINTGNRSYHLAGMGLIQRQVPQERESNFLLYEGPLGTFKDGFQEISYEKIQEKRGMNPELSEQGWFGLTDKYWLVAVVPAEKTSPGFQVTTPSPGVFATTVSGTTKPQLLEPHQTLTSQVRFFTGPKILSLLDDYEKKYNLDHFDLAVDFGWFYFLTKPIFYALTWLKGLTGNFGFAILVFTVLLKALFFPLANKSYHAMARMKRLQPALEQLRARYKDDPAKLNQEMMAFYKREKVNPVSGCLPMVLQIPAFFALYKVLFVSIEMRHAPFLGWIHDLSAPDPTNLFTLFGLIPWSPPSLLHLGIWPLLMGLSMVLQQRLNPPPVDPIQRKIFQYVMPVVFTFMLGQFASGLVIYWTWNNLLSVIQQWLIMRSDAEKTDQKLLKKAVNKR